ncbi:Hypothetical protein GSB_150425 [Giardia duodenalis]|uniref:Uncharacterized protein n=1 Tax=Giardia intestinalis TaxID=5741 RepID=V6U4B2_GIAIN|nr:Hypothetical protein GSB_150425 [Giardia intestinalis]
MPSCTVELSLYFLAQDRVYAYLCYRNLPILSRVSKHEPFGVLFPAGRPCLIKCQNSELFGERLDAEWSAACKPTASSPRMLFLSNVQADDAKELSELSLVAAYSVSGDIFFGDKSLLVSKFEGLFPIPEIFTTSAAQIGGFELIIKDAHLYISKSMLIVLSSGESATPDTLPEQAILHQMRVSVRGLSSLSTSLVSSVELQVQEYTEKLELLANLIAPESVQRSSPSLSSSSDILAHLSDSLGDANIPIYLFDFSRKDECSTNPSECGLQAYRPNRFFVSLVADIEIYSKPCGLTWIHRTTTPCFCGTTLRLFLDDIYRFIQLFLQKIELRPIIYLYPVSTVDDCNAEADLVQYSSRAGLFNTVILIPFLCINEFLSSAELCINVAANIFTYCFLSWAAGSILLCSTTHTRMTSSLTDFVMLSLFYQYKSLVLSFLSDSGLCMDSHHTYDPQLLDCTAVSRLLGDIHALRQTTCYRYDKRLDLQIYELLMTLHRASSLDLYSTQRSSKYLSDMLKLFAFSLGLDFPSDILTSTWAQDNVIKEVECAFFSPILTRYVALHDGSHVLHTKNRNTTSPNSHLSFLPTVMFVCTPTDKTYITYFEQHVEPIRSIFSQPSQSGSSQSSVFSCLKTLLLLPSNIAELSPSLSPQLKPLQDILTDAKDVFAEFATHLKPPMTHAFSLLENDYIKFATHSKHTVFSPPVIYAQFYSKLYSLPQITVQSELLRLAEGISIVNTVPSKLSCLFCPKYTKNSFLLQILTPKIGLKSSQRLLEDRQSKTPDGVLCIKTAAQEYSPSLSAAVELTKIISSAHNQVRVLEQLYIQSHRENNRQMSILTHFNSTLSAASYSLKFLLDKTIQNERPVILLKTELNFIFKNISTNSNEYFPISGGSFPTDSVFIHILHPGSFRDLIAIFYARDFSNLQLNSGILMPYPPTNRFVPKHTRSSILGIVEPFLLFVCPRGNPPNPSYLIEALNMSARNAHLHFLYKIGAELSQMGTINTDLVDTVMSTVETQGIFSQLSIYFLVMSKLLFVLRSIILNEASSVTPSLRRAAASYLYLIGDRVWLIDYLTTLLRIIRHYIDQSSAIVAAGIVKSLLPIFCRVDAGLYLLLQLCIRGVCSKERKALDTNRDGLRTVMLTDAECRCSLVYNMDFCAQVLRNAAIFSYTRATGPTVSSFDLQRSCSATCLCDLDGKRISSGCESKPKTACTLRTMLGIQRKVTDLIELLMTPTSVYGLRIVTSLDDVSELVQAVLFYAVTRIRLFSETEWLSKLPSICETIYIYIGRYSGGSDSPCNHLSIAKCPEPIRTKVQIIHLQMLANLLSIPVKNHELVVAEQTARSSSPYWTTVYQMLSHLIQFNTPISEFTLSSVLHMLVKLGTTPHLVPQCQQMAFQLAYILLSRTNIVSPVAPAHFLYIDIITGAFGTHRVTHSLTFLEWTLEVQPYITYFMNNFGGYAFNPQRPSIPRIFSFMEPACPDCFFGTCTCSFLSDSLYYKSVGEMAHEPFLKKMLALGQTVLSMMNLPVAICGDMRIYADYEQSFTLRIEELRKPRIEERMDFLAKLMRSPEEPQDTDNPSQQMLTSSELAREEMRLLQGYCIYSQNGELRVMAQRILKLITLILGDTIAKYDVPVTWRLILRDAPHKDRMLDKSESVLIHFKDRCICMRSYSSS